MATADLHDLTFDCVLQEWLRRWSDAGAGTGCEGRAASGTRRARLSRTHGLVLHARWPPVHAAGGPPDGRTQSRPTAGWSSNRERERRHFRRAVAHSRGGGV